MDDCLIVGGGVVGLSIAYELACHGVRVRVLDRQQPAAEASWAGAGILPTAEHSGSQTPLERLASLSLRLHAQWAERLREETGINNEFRQCGAWYLVLRQPGGSKHSCPEIASGKCIELAKVAGLEPALAAACDSQTIESAWLAEDEAQVRNPRHLRALLAACDRRGVKIEPGVEVTGFWSSANQIVGAQTSAGPKYAGAFCVTTGAWSRRLVESLGLSIGIKPIRGQIVLLRKPNPPLTRIVNVDKRYLVPRCDGRVIVGSTEEDVGFEKRTTAEGIAGLLKFTETVIPPWEGSEVERTWAGLRPATADGLPFLGRVPDLRNAFVAAGHFRSGIYLSTATAVVMSELIRGVPPSMDLSAFRLERADSLRK